MSVLNLHESSHCFRDDLDGNDFDGRAGGIDHRTHFLAHVFGAAPRWRGAGFDLEAVRFLLSCRLTFGCCRGFPRKLESFVASRLCPSLCKLGIFLRCLSVIATTDCCLGLHPREECSSDAA
ncbi:hypothetical protein B4915_09440 [Leucobacter massiliensis]|uniref:Uncharacterized protein n=1 Tax=Leucobacter massiliensis TaxID=1686285 RepID=A0A2S9QNA7_9MICO|nr:hypothetical protein B4915_09440 [Leucobacter massiliensis]